VEDVRPQTPPDRQPGGRRVEPVLNRVAGFGPPVSAPPTWEIGVPAADPEPDVCRRRAAAARTQAARMQDPMARAALEMVAVNWENLGRHLSDRPRPGKSESPRKAEARRAALGIED
jgi:hypothetical protein